MSSRGKRRRPHPRPPEAEIGRARAAPVRRPKGRRRQSRGLPWPAIVIGGLVLLAVAAGLAYVLGLFPGAAPPTAACATPDAARPSGPPDATPLANPPAQPTGDGTRATIETELGTIAVELYCGSSPVAAQNFINLAKAGYYDGVVFHRIVPGFVIQGGDPEGTGQGGPGYTIVDEPIVGEYRRGIVAMARTPAPNSQGSQFFVVLDDDAPLDPGGGYAIFGEVVEGMDVVDQIAAGEAEEQIAINPVAMTSVTVQR
jgi:cyclophilin family peptidyl-prolyl cis-trans isomerase